MILQRIDTPPKPTPMAAVFAMQSRLGAHVGILHPDDDGGVWLLHQAWNRDSRHETFAAFCAELDGSPLFFVPPGLDEDEQSAVRAAAILAAKHLPEGGLPYAFGSATLDSETGFVLDESCGLSCATLVNVVFQSAKVKLLTEETWASQRTQARADQDREAKMRVANSLARSVNQLDRDQAKRVSSESDRPRLRAEEIAAASSQKTRPLDLLTAEPLGKQVLEEMVSLIHESSQCLIPPNNS